MHISFHGAAGGVTGSCHLVEAAGRRILVDCGMFQGSHELNEENAADFGFDPASIDILLLTHAHLDHCGRIPLLVQRGFGGEIITTGATRDLTRLVLLDSAHLHEEEAHHRRRHGASGNARKPLYDTVDALDAMGLFGRVASYGQAIDLGHGVRATFHDAGHILGSASVHLRVPADGRIVTLGFSGDLGNPQAAFMRPATPPSAADALILEATYGDREHPPLDDALTTLAHILAEAHARGGNVIIPCFAVARTQEMLFHLGELHRQGRLPQDVVYLDSPLAIEATRVYEHYADWWAPAQRHAFQEAGAKGFRGWLPALRLCYTGAASRAINNVDSAAVIIAGSGMCSGGRVLHHLRRHLDHPRHHVVLVGFQAPGTLGRALHDGADAVDLFGEVHAVRARIHALGAFSAHAGQSDLCRWAEAASAERVFLVHGEYGPMQALQARLAAVSRGDVFIAERGQPQVLE